MYRRTDSRGGTMRDFKKWRLKHEALSKLLSEYITGFSIWLVHLEACWTSYQLARVIHVLQFRFVIVKYLKRINFDHSSLFVDASWWSVCKQLIVIYERVHLIYMHC